MDRTRCVVMGDRPPGDRPLVLGCGHDGAHAEVLGAAAVHLIGATTPGRPPGWLGCRHGVGRSNVLVLTDEGRDPRHAMWPVHAEATVTHIAARLKSEEACTPAGILGRLGGVDEFGQWPAAVIGPVWCSEPAGHCGNAAVKWRNDGAAAGENGWASTRNADRLWCGCLNSDPRNAPSGRHVVEIAIVCAPSVHCQLSRCSRKELLTRLRLSFYQATHETLRDQLPPLAIEPKSATSLSLTPLHA